jgi:hypothetical protein
MNQPVMIATAALAPTMRRIRVVQVREGNGRSERAGTHAREKEG